MKILTLTLNPCIDQTLWVEDFNRPPIRTEKMSGGKGMNVARVLSLLGEDCLAVAPSGGAAGKEFSALAQAEGIRLTAVPIQGTTRTIRTYARISDYSQRVERESGPLLTDVEISALRQTVLSLLPGCAVLAICGSSPCKNGARLIADLIIRAKEMGVRTLLDANGEALIYGAEALPDVLKINEDELGQLVDLSNDPLHPEANRLTLEKGISRVLLTLGEKGCAQFTGEQVFFCPAPKVECINAVGSGDCFTAAWLYAQIHGFSDNGALLLGCAAGAANASRFPAACITRSDIENLVGFRWNT